MIIISTRTLIKLAVSTAVGGFMFTVLYASQEPTPNEPVGTDAFATGKINTNEVCQPPVDSPFAEDRAVAFDSFEEYIVHKAVTNQTDAQPCRADAKPLAEAIPAGAFIQ